MIELKTRGGGEARIFGCLPATERVGVRVGCRLVGVWRPAEAEFWGMGAWQMDGLAAPGVETKSDLMDVPDDIEVRLTTIIGVGASMFEAAYGLDRTKWPQPWAMIYGMSGRGKGRS